MLTLKKKDQFSALFDRHYRRLFNYSLKVLKDKDGAEEVVQETFIKLWEHIDDINSDDKSIASYLIVTLKNKLIDLHRKNQTRTRHTHQFTETVSLEASLDTDWELIDQIEMIFESLPERTAEIFQLSRKKGLNYKEIAKEMGVSLKTVESHISTALKAFRSGLKDYF